MSLMILAGGWLSAGEAGMFRDTRPAILSALLRSFSTSTLLLGDSDSRDGQRATAATSEC